MSTWSSFGIKCPDNSRFYNGNSTSAFLGCCTVDPASTRDGLCPNQSLRATTFNPTAYSSIPKQACAGPDAAAAGAQWFVCAYTKPPFMGCCAAAAPCDKGCAQADLRPAKLSSNVEDANVFLGGGPSDPSPTSTTLSSSSSSASAPSSTALSSSSSSNSAHQGMQPATVAGLAVGTAAGVSAMALLLFWLVRRRRTAAAPPAPSSVMMDRHGYALPDSQCQTPAWTMFDDDGAAAYAKHASYASLHQGGSRRHPIPPENSAVAKHASLTPTELPGSDTTTTAVFELHEETSPPLRMYGFAPR